MGGETLPAECRRDMSCGLILAEIAGSTWLPCQTDALELAQPARLSSMSKRQTFGRRRRGSRIIDIASNT